MHTIQPYVTSIVEALAGLLAVLLLGVIRSLRVKAEAWLEAHTTAAQLDTVHKLAAEAAALVEVTYKEAGGPQKLAAALEYVVDKLDAAGINVDPVAIRAAIEKAVQDFNAKGSGAGAGKIGE